MSEILVGDVLARLRADVSQFNQTLNDVVARLGRLNQATQQVTAQGHAQQLQAQRLAAQAQAQAQTQAQATSLQATRLAAAAQRQVTAQTHSATLQAARAATQAHLQVAAQGHAEHLQATRLAAQAQLQALRLAHQQQLQEARIAAQERARAERGSGSGLGTVLQVAGGIGVATGVGALIGQMKDLAVSTAQVGIRFESLRASLSALGGSQTAGFQQFQMLTDMAQRLGVALEPLAQGWRQFTAAATQAGLPMADQVRLMEAMSKEARNAGASNEEMGRAIQAVAQIASKGKVSMEELRQQLGEALPRAMAAAALGMGTTTEALTKLVETGTLGFPSFVRALTRGFEQLDTSGGKFAEGTQQALNKLETAWKIFQDTVMQGGLNAYLVTVIENFRSAVEFTTKLLPPRREPVTPDIARLTPSAEESREVTRLRNLIDLYNKKAEAETNAATREQYLGMVGRAREQLGQTLDTMQATRTQVAEQEKLTDASNKAAHAQEQQADFVKNLTKALEEASKASARFRAEAAQFPERFGRLGGTAEEAKQYRQGLEQAQTAPLEAVGKLISERPAGVVVPPEQLKQFEALRKEYGGLELATKAADAAEKARQETVRKAKQAQQEALRQAKQAQQEALRQAEQAQAQLPTMEALIGRAGTLLRRPDENVAEEARSRAQQLFVQLQADVEKALEALADSPALQRLGPTLEARLKDILAQIPQAMQAEGQQAFDQVLERQILEPLRALAGESDEAIRSARQLEEAARLAAQAAGTAYEAEAKRLFDIVQDLGLVDKELQERRREFARSGDLLGLELTPDQERARTFETQMEQTLERLRTPRAERESTRLRQRAAREGIEITPEYEAQLQALNTQERWNTIIAETERLGDQAAQTITTGLLSIVDGTVAVSDGFKGMAKSILQSIAEVTLNEGFRSLIRLGLGVAFGAIGGAAGGAIGGGAATNTTLNSPSYMSLLMGNAPRGAEGLGPINRPTLALIGEGSNNPEYVLNRQQMDHLITAAMRDGAHSSRPVALQHGGIVNRPTMAMLGENPAHNPETVLNRQQMQSLMASGPSAGGQAVNVTTILVDSRAKADQVAAQERSLGRQVIIQEVVNELSQGAGSKIGQVLRSTLR